MQAIIIAATREEAVPLVEQPQEVAGTGGTVEYRVTGIESGPRYTWTDQAAAFRAEVVEVGTCIHVQERQEPHGCPYSEISHDDALCTCCESCERACARDV